MTSYSPLSVAVLLTALTTVSAEATVVAELGSVRGTGSIGSVTLDGGGIYLADFYSGSTGSSSGLNFQLNGVTQDSVGLSGGQPFTYRRAFSLPDGQHTLDFQSTGGSLAYNFDVVRLASNVAELGFTQGTAPIGSVTLNGGGIYLANFYTGSTGSSSGLSFQVNGVAQDSVSFSGGQPFAYSRAFSLPDGQHTFAFQSTGGSISHNFDVVRVDPSVAELGFTRGTAPIGSVTLEGGGIYIADFYSDSTGSVSELSFQVNGVTQDSVSVSGGQPFAYSRAFSLPDGQHTFAFQSTGGSLSHNFDVVRISTISVVPEANCFVVWSLLSVVFSLRRSR